MVPCRTLTKSPKSQNILALDDLYFIENLCYCYCIWGPRGTKFPIDTQMTQMMSQRLSSYTHLDAALVFLLVLVNLGGVGGRVLEFWLEERTMRLRRGDELTKPFWGIELRLSSCLCCSYSIKGLQTSFSWSVKLMSVIVALFTSSVDIECVCGHSAVPSATMVFNSRSSSATFSSRSLQSRVNVDTNSFSCCVLSCRDWALSAIWEFFFSSVFWSLSCSLCKESWRLPRNARRTSQYYWCSYTIVFSTIWKMGLDRASIVGKLKPTAVILEWPQWREEDENKENENSDIFYLKLMNKIWWLDTN